MCIRDSPLPDQADPAPAEAADVPAPAEAEAAAAPAAPPKASKKIVYKTKTSTVKSSMKARLWKDVVFCTIEVVDPHLQQEAVCTMPACGGADKKAMRKINIFDAVREYKNVAFVKKILHESEQGDQEAAMLNEDSKTPDFYVSGRETEEDREIYRVLSKAISRTILKYAESGEWDKLLEILPSFANSRDKGDLSEFLRGRDALSPHGWTALHLATRRNMYSHAIILAESRADLEQKDLMLGYTALHHAIANGSVDCVKELLKGNSVKGRREARVHARTDLENQDAFQLCRQYQKEATDPAREEKFGRIGDLLEQYRDQVEQEEGRAGAARSESTTTIVPDDQF
eukprot:TRINITY_DN11877_c0_g1_i1.p1 TRINITY_DN11877_c0_g1~~TRINITY_DN11877_c0_g1_i1.p1  ORF type:complete len:344 (-),score=90.41 TRINITY_DN11877_c0_g1_i1:177-1208(-)